jgi:hypothetical protein
MYCNFQETGKIFNNKKVYKCSNCQLELGLDDPNINVLCFEQEMTLKRQLAQQYEENNKKAEAIIKEQQEKDNNVQDEDLCSKDQIDERMAICNKCEHYKDNACLLCGCRVVREHNYNNKLANKKASCPDGRWGSIS